MGHLYDSVPFQELPPGPPHGETLALTEIADRDYVLYNENEHTECIRTNCVYDLSGML